MSCKDRICFFLCFCCTMYAIFSQNRSFGICQSKTVTVRFRSKPTTITEISKSPQKWANHQQFNTFSQHNMKTSILYLEVVEFDVLPDLLDSLRARSLGNAEELAEGRGDRNGFGNTAGSGRAFSGGARRCWCLFSGGGGRGGGSCCGQQNPRILEKPHGNSGHCCLPSPFSLLCVVILLQWGVSTTMARWDYEGFCGVTGRIPSERVRLHWNLRDNFTHPLKILIKYI